jgi:serine/threonine protein kinase
LIRILIHPKDHGSLHHPNIAVAHSWGITDWNEHRVLFVVSEQLTGGSVRDMLDRGRLLTPSQALLVGLDVCKALDVLHRKGLVHGDIRPGTLVFGDDRRLRVVDVGLSQVLVSANDNVHRSNDLAKYASPEQAQNLPITSKSDVYSLCLTLFETLTGTVPFVVDPVCASMHGDPLLHPSALETLRTRLFPLASLVTPNLDEVRLLVGIDVVDDATQRDAARALHDLGPAWALVKGGHPEVEGTMGQVKEGVFLIENSTDVANLSFTSDKKLAFVTQTTLSVDETKEIVAALTQKFPDIVQPRKQDICYATQNRQDAVKFMAPQVEVVIVVGSASSSNSNRLRELSEKLGVPSYMVDAPDQLKPEWFAGKKRVGLTAGASAPESLAQAIVARIQEFGPRSVRALSGVVEDVTFSLPKNLVD